MKPLLLGMWYSLGRVAAWGSTGAAPAPNVDLAAPEPWRRFVRLLTDNEATRRPADMARVLELLALVDTEPPAVPGIPNQSLQQAKDGDVAATIMVLNGAADYLDDGPFFIDELSHVTGPGLEDFVRSQPATARTLVLQMEHHLVNEPWERRSFDHYNVPLRWIHRVAEAAVLRPTWT